MENSGGCIAMHAWASTSLARRSERRSVCLAARRIGGTFLFPTLHTLFTYKDKPA